MLLAILGAIALNLILCWRIAVLIKEEEETMICLKIRAQNLQMIMEELKKEMNKYELKIKPSSTTKNSNINEHTVDFTTTTGKPNDGI